MTDLPLSLTRQCLDSFGRYLSDQMEVLMDISQDPSSSSNNFRSTYLKPVCMQIEIMIQHALTARNCFRLNMIKFARAVNATCYDEEIANKITKTLLGNLLSQLDNLKYRHGGIHNCLWLKNERHTLCEEVAAEMAAAIFLPCVTQFDFYFAYDFINSSEAPQHFISQFLFKIQSKMKMLNSFTIRVNPDSKFIVSDCLLRIQNLQSFSYHNYCHDHVIAVLCNYCKQLTVLDVRESKQVTDESIPYIVSLENLRTLQILGTGISSSGLRNIVKNSWVTATIESNANTSSIISFSANVNPVHILLLSTNFVNLTSLGIVLSEKWCLDPLEDLYLLQSLEIGTDITSNNFSDLSFGIFRNLIETIGYRLRELTFRDVYGINVKSISFSCISLKYLSLEFSALGSDKVHIPEFMSDCNSELGCGLSCFFPWCYTVNKLRLSGLIWSSEFVVNCLMQGMVNGDIRELNVNGNDIVMTGKWTVLCNLFGCSSIISFCDLEPIVRNWFNSAGNIVIQCVCSDHKKSTLNASLLIQFPKEN